MERDRDAVEIEGGTDTCISETSCVVNHQATVLFILHSIVVVAGSPFLAE